MRCKIERQLLISLCLVVSTNMLFFRMEWLQYFMQLSIVIKLLRSYWTTDQEWIWRLMYLYHAYFKSFVIIKTEKYSILGRKNTGSFCSNVCKQRNDKCFGKQKIWHNSCMAGMWSSYSYALSFEIGIAKFKGWNHHRLFACTSHSHITIFWEWLFYYAHKVYTQK